MKTGGKKRSPGRDGIIDEEGSETSRKRTPL
jgi:hypothetical protein